MTPTLLDTGVIVAWLDRSEKYHRACREAVDAVVGPLITCEPVITEACYLLRRIAGAPEAVLENVQSGVFQLPVPLIHSAAAIQKIFRKYKDRQVDLADACLVHLANELRTGQILTLDSNFKVYRWGLNKAFHLVVEL